MKWQTGTEINVVIDSVFLKDYAEDILETTKESVVFVMPEETTWFDVLVQCGVFSSKAQARKNWESLRFNKYTVRSATWEFEVSNEYSKDGHIDYGLWELLNVGKMKLQIYVFHQYPTFINHEHVLYGSKSYHQLIGEVMSEYRISLYHEHKNNSFIRSEL